MNKHNALLITFRVTFGEKVTANLQRTTLIDYSEFQQMIKC